MQFNFNIQNDGLSQPMKVMFVTHNYIRFKGDYAGVFLHLLARKLGNFGIEVTVIAPHDAAMPEFEIIDGIKIYRFRYGDDNHETLAYRGDMDRQIMRNPLKIFRLIKFLRSAYKSACSIVETQNIRIISIHWLVPNGIVGYFLKRHYGNKIDLFISSHGTDIRLLKKWPIIYYFFKPIVRRAKYWTVVSNFLKTWVESHYKSVSDRLRVIPLPNDESVFSRDSEISKEPTLIVAISRLTSQKRLPVLLRAIKMASADLPEIRLEIYGAGPERAKLVGLITELGLEGRARLFDPLPQEELRKIYNRASIVVLNSAEEGFGLALTEAMLCRTAVIGTISGGITDIIDDNKTGLLVPLDDDKKLAEAIIKLIKDNRLCAQLALNGYNKALENFSSASSAKRYAALFRA
ncbi:MAG: glycosyltransferase family 4 protein [candidate division Zixibacteria bacterium]|nr:glycosyltransferase family 4 protein [candidate division Zixibacteria bacterium]